MIIEMTSDIGEAYKSGQILELADDKARTLITMGDAKESDVGSLLRASNKADMDKYKAELLAEVRALRPQSKKAAPPDGGGGVPFDRLDGGDPPDLKKMKQEERWYHAGQMMRAVGQALHPESPQEEREAGRNLLHNLYCQKRGVTYKVVPGDGEEGMQRFNDHMSVTRTGTESISGGSTYGFLVKPEWNETLFRIPIEESVIEPYAYNVPTWAGARVQAARRLDQYTQPTAGP